MIDLILPYLPFYLGVGFFGAVIAIRDFFFDNLGRLCVDDQDQDGDDQ